MALAIPAVELNENTDKSYKNPPVPEGTIARLVLQSVKSIFTSTAYVLNFHITHTWDGEEWVELDDKKYNRNVGQWLNIAPDAQGRNQFWKTKRFLSDAGVLDETEALAVDIETDEFVGNEKFDVEFEGMTIAQALEEASAMIGEAKVYSLNLLLPRLVGIMEIEGEITHRTGTDKKGQPVVYQGLSYKGISTPR